MTVLLDTHVFLWLTTGERKLTDLATRTICNPQNTKLISLASCWEIAIKHSIGRLRLTTSLDELFQEEIEGNGMSLLTISTRHIVAVSKLDRFHGDPFDRLLVAQCQVENLALISADQSLDDYNIRRIW